MDVLEQNRKSPNPAEPEYPSYSMTESDNALPEVTERFPEREATIRERYERDAEFQEVCLDYAEACRALHHWQGVSDESADRVIEQYRALLQELEVEILAFVQEGPDCAEPGL